MKKTFHQIQLLYQQYFNILDFKNAFSLLSPYVYKHRKAYYGLIFFLILEISLTLAAAWFMGSITDAAVKSNFNDLKWLVPLGIILTLISVSSSYFSTYFETTASSTIIRDMKIDLYKHILLLPASKTSSLHTGELLSHFTNDIHNVGGLIGSSLINIIRLPLLSIAAFIYLLHISWKLALLSTIVAPLALVTGVYFGLLLRRNSRMIHKLISDLNTLLSESFQGLNVIRVFTMEKLLHQKFIKQNEALYSLQLKNTKLSGLFSSGSQAISSVAFLVSLCLGAYYVSIQEITVGSLLSFINLINHLIYPLTGLAGLWASYQYSFTAIERLNNILNHPQESKELSFFTNPKPVHNSIELKNVTFSYDGKNPVFENFNLQLPAGKHIAIVGHSGAGKTTLFNLLLGLYKPQAGQILIDEVSITHLSFSELRSKIAHVPQESFLFDGTIRENLMLARPEVTIGEMVEAAKAANIHDFIMSLDDAYETHIGERGTKLSGGQKQRIAIARALLKDSPLLLLDEATSALDSETEYHVKTALVRLMKGRTTLVIAHRLSTVENADLIIVMDEGNIIQKGKHNELLNTPGVYRNLYNTNFQSKNKNAFSVV